MDNRLVTYFLVTKYSKQWQCVPAGGRSAVKLEKFLLDLFCCFDTIPACDTRTHTHISFYKSQFPQTDPRDAVLSVHRAVDKAGG